MTHVHGRVTDHTGAPQPGVWVYAFLTDTGLPRPAPGTHSSRDGTWALDLPDGAWTVREVGHKTHAVRLAGAAVDVQTPVATAAVAAAPTGRASLARLTSRRRAPRATPDPESEPQE